MSNMSVFIGLYGNEMGKAAESGDLQIVFKLATASHLADWNLIESEWEIASRSGVRTAYGYGGEEGLLGR